MEFLRLDNISLIIDFEPNLFHECNLLQRAVDRMDDLFIPEGKVYPRSILEKMEELGEETEDEIDTYVSDVVRQRAGKCIFWKEARRMLVQLLGRGGGVAEGFLGIQRRKFEQMYNYISIAQNEKTISFEIDDEIESLTEDEEEEEEEEEEGGCWLRNYNSSRRRWSYEVEFQTEEKVLLEKLINGGLGVEDDADEPSVISITGMTYSARSALASNIIYHPSVAAHFSLVSRVWVSHFHTRRECLEAMMEEQLTEDIIKTMTDQDLLSHLERYLTSTRFLLVLDGDFCSKSHFWSYSFDLLFKNKLRSKIILTAESSQVISPPGVTFRCDLQLLTREDSCNLLFSKVCGRGGGGGCPSEQLARIGNKIANRCGGLPLAIVLIAGVLQWKKTLSWWQRVYRSLRKINNVHDELQILELIYNYLPHHLKLCFLYLGHFPRDCEIRSRQLITLWIAEGFVVIPKSCGKKSMEEAAAEHLEDLVSWNLIQPIKNKCCGGGIKSLRIHPFLRVFCMSKAGQVKDLQVGVYDNKSSLRSASTRRILIHSGTLHFIKSKNPYAPKLRSLICFGGGGERISSRDWKPVCNGYILLRVLELWGVVVDNIPSEIGNLISLRYLRLKSDSAKVLPSSIHNLLNLQTLEVAAPLVELPHLNIWKLPKLRHLYVNSQVIIPDPLASSGCLSALRTLSTISPRSCTESFVSRVPNVDKLGICGDLETHMKSAFNNLPKLKLARKLKVVRDRRYGRLTTFPDGDKFPPMLVKLTLMHTELSVDPLKQLAEIPNLQVLKLMDGACGEGQALDCSNCEFPKLKVLKLVNMGITRLSVLTKSMPSLQNLVIDRCGSLVDLPSDNLKHMSTLRELHLLWPNLSMVRCATEMATYKEKRHELLKLVIYHAPAPAPAPRGTADQFIHI